MMARIALACLCSWAVLTASPTAQAGDRAAVAQTFEGFYAAMKAGDATKVMQAVAPDAVFLEGGRRETRAEYKSGHLQADMGFERAVSGKRGPLAITTSGDAAWVIAMTDYQGTFEGKPVNFVSEQLMVLTRTNGRWMIRAVHWSSLRR